MRPIHRIFQISLFMALVLFSLPMVVAQNVDVTINDDQGTHIINKHIYGHFAEHLGRCIYDGICVGENSGITNMNGVRKDIIDALKALKIPNLRWPGAPRSSRA